MCWKETRQPRFTRDTNGGPRLSTGHSPRDIRRTSYGLSITRSDTSPLVCPMIVIVVAMFEFTECWYSAPPPIADRAQLSDIIYDPCPPLAREAGTSPCHKYRWITLFEQQKATIQTTALSKATRLGFGSRVKHKVSRFGELLGYWRPYSLKLYKPRISIPCPTLALRLKVRRHTASPDP